tara:strand:- start:15 stop:437 length:423 start_codon:yes stop_codon:yes gene_type:complete
MGNTILGCRLSYFNNSNIELYKLKGIYLSKVVDVYDGDTVTVVLYNKGDFEKHKLRLNGIDTPELKPKKDIENREDEIEKAKDAKEFLSNQILNKIVNLNLIGYDKYGRLLGNIIYNNIDINKLMITNGYAKSYDGGKKN